jgi:hypothetical protein
VIAECFAHLNIVGGYKAELVIEANEYPVRVTGIEDF